MRQHRPRLRIFTALGLVALAALGSCCKKHGSVPEAQIAVGLNPHAEYTNAGEVRLTGTAPGGTTLRIRAVNVQFDHEVAGGRFVVDVPLQANRVNRIQIVPRFASGTEGLPITTQVIQDQEAPEVWIDTPAADARVPLSQVTVNGRVSDRLLGGRGITVTVNGVVAEVETGIGQNGTFLARGVTLAEGGRIEAIAQDVLGNESRRATAVTVGTGPMGRVAETFGDLQMGGVNSLLPDQIGVRLERPNGAPLTDKLVTFLVARSDGGVSTNGIEFAMRHQVRTDPAGIARVFWRLGTDAGAGNNRVLAQIVDVADVTFYASATPGATDQINIGDGNNQRAEVRAVAPLPLQVWVSDGCNGISDVEVAFTVTEGGGRVGPALGQIVGPSVTVRTDATGHAAVRLEVGATAGINMVEANFTGNPGLPSVFQCLGLARDPAQPTAFEGMVQDNAMQPLGGATCTLQVDGVMHGPELSDANGRFVFSDVTRTGAGLLRVEGETVNLRGGEGGAVVPAGSYPRLSYDAHIVANARNGIATPVLLPPLETVNNQTYDGTADVVLRVDGIAGLQMKIKAGSMRVPEPSDPTQYWTPSQTRTVPVSLNQVHSDEVPMPLPDGAAPGLTWTLQPAGALFDPPVEVEYPNVSGLAPGTTVYFLTFDHDIERFVVGASGRVKEDGSASVTDPGGGLRKAGWGCQCPPYAPTVSIQTQPVNENSCRRLRAEIETAIELAIRRQNDAYQEVGIARDMLREVNDETGTLYGAITTLLQCAIETIISKAALLRCLGIGSGVVTGGWLIEHRGAEAKRSNAAVLLLQAAENVALERGEVSRALQAARSAADDCMIGLLQLENHLFSMDATIRVIEGDIRGALDDISDEMRHEILERLNTTASDQLSAAGFGDVTRKELIEFLEHALGQSSMRRHAVEACNNSLSLMTSSLKELVLAQNAVTWPEFIIAANGQSGRMTDDGAITINNVPSGEQLSRVIGRSYESGVAGASGYFRLAPASSVIDAGPFSVYMSHLPRLLAMQTTLNGAQSMVMTALGQTVASATVGTISYSGEEPMNGEVRGTSYGSSNASIAAVGTDGVVSAQGRGRAFIVARNEGVTAVAQVTVSLGDPLTTLEGQVLLPSGDPADGARVTLSTGATAIAGADGRFVIAGQPTLAGDLGVEVELEIGGVRYRTFRSGVIPTSPVTDVGLMQLQSLAIDTTFPVCVAAPAGQSGGEIRVLDASGMELSRHAIPFRAISVARDVNGDAILVGGSSIARTEFQNGFRVIWHRTFPSHSFVNVAIGPDGAIWALDANGVSGGQQRQPFLVRCSSAGLETGRSPWPFLEFYSVGTATGLSIMRTGPNPTDYLACYAVWQDRLFNYVGHNVSVDASTLARTSVPGALQHSGAVSPAGEFWVGSGSVGGGEGSIRRLAQNLTQVGGLMILPIDRGPFGIVFRGDGDAWVATTHSNAQFVEDMRRYRQGAQVQVVNVPGTCFWSGAWIGGDGTVWGARAGCGQLFAMNSDGSNPRVVPTGPSPSVRGDPTGYQLAYTVMPDLDFDLDGMANGAEIGAGRNPFVADN